MDDEKDDDNDDDDGASGGGGVGDESQEPMSIWRSLYAVGALVVKHFCSLIMNEVSGNLKWFVIFLPHTSRHIGITRILDHNSDLSWILRHVYFWSFKLKNSVWKKYVIGTYQLTPMISEWCWRKKFKPCFNPRTYKGGAGGDGWLPPLPKVFLIFFLDDKISGPDVFCSCSFIPRAHFETSLVMVSYYGYEIWRHK